MPRRGRTLLVAAMVAGAGYLAGKIVQQVRDAEAEEYARITAYESAGDGVPDTSIERLKQLGQLHAQGILNDEEFAAAKTKLFPGA